MRHILNPTVIQAAGNPPKEIQEFIGRVNTGTAEVSIARMRSPPGWREPVQTPAFNEYTVVLKGALHATVNGREVIAQAGQALLVEAGESVQYCTPGAEGAEYLAVCVPAFSPQTVRRQGA